MVFREYNFIGIRIKEVRIKKGFTQEQLAHKLDLVENQISTWETGKRRPTLVNFIKLCHIFEVSPNELLNWE